MTGMSEQLPDSVSSRRSRAGRVLRFLYSSIVIGLGLFLGWQLVKPMIFTQSSGAVVAPYYVVSTPFVARITELTVKPGDRVQKDQVVAVVRSPEIDSLRANLLSAVAEQINKEADLRIRLRVAKSSLEPARNRVAAADECADMVKLHPNDVTTVFRGQVLRECAQAAAELAQIEAIIEEAYEQIEAVRQARERIQELQDFVDRAFNDGKQLSPNNGIVAGQTANPGQSVTAGTSIVEIYDPTALYVQWVLAANRLIQPDIGAPVYVLDGSRVMRGTIKEVYAIAEQAQEGVTVFSKIRSGQLVRIELANNEDYPAYMTDVEVRYLYWRFLDGAVDLYVDIMTGLGLWREK